VLLHGRGFAQVATLRYRKGLIADVVQFSVNFIAQTMNETFYGIIDKGGAEPSKVAAFLSIAALVRLHGALVGDAAVQARDWARHAKDAPIC